MKNRLAYSLVSAWVLTVALPAAAETTLRESEASAVKVAIYNQNLAMIYDTRTINLPVGEAVVAFEGVAEQMQPMTALIEAPQVEVLEKNYEYDLLNYYNLLEASIGQEVKTVMLNHETSANIFDKAVLLNVYNGSPLLRFDYGVDGNFPGRVVFDSVPDNLRIKPTLVAKLKNAVAGTKDLRLSYLTGGLSWQADYVAQLGDGKMTLQGFVTLNNQSGADYKDAVVQLVSGEVNAPRPQPLARGLMQAKFAALNSVDATVESASDNPQPQAVGGHYVYTLPHKTDILNKQSKQVSFLQLDNMEYERVYRFESPLNARYNESFERQKVDMLYKFVNKQEQNLPRGTIRFYENGGDNEPQFVGSADFPQLAKGEKAELPAGKSSDVYADGKITKQQKLSDKMTEASFEIELFNGGSQNVKVEVTQMARGDVNVTAESLKHTDDGTAGRLKWLVEVPAQGKTVLTYTLRITEN